MDDTLDRLVILGGTIARRRAELGLIHRQPATTAGTSHSYIWKLETGSVDVRMKTLCRIADALSYSVNDLIEF